MLTRADGELSPVLPCDTVRAEAFAAFDGELAATTLAAIDSHLTLCSACRARLAADAAFHRVVRQVLSLDIAPPALRERIALLPHAPTTENASA
jgi:predicted anti-sigma-YlaC factor YlaD